MEYQYLICHYAEVGLKGKNRRFFEEKLIENIKRVLKPGYFDSVRRISGRIIVKLSEKVDEKPAFAKATAGKEITQALKRVFGLAFFSFAVSTKQNIESIQKKALEILKDIKFKSFKINTQRSKKDFPLTSREINEKVGEYILKKSKFPACAKASAGRQNPNSKIKVDLEKPDVTLFIEIVEKYAFLYLEKIKGPGGLPMGVSGKAMVLLSGGIDSPVAAWQIMKRGVRAIFVHFHALPYTNKASIEKVKKIAKILNEYQGDSNIYLVPFADIQKEVLLKTPAKLRVILYRRFMLKIAQTLAKKENALALATGESIGQVASQTLENIRAIQEVAELPVLRPLIGQDKQDIILLAKQIGTYDISILPHEDCCSRFLPKHPETKAQIHEIKRVEQQLKTGELIGRAIEETKLVKFLLRGLTNFSTQFKLK